MKRLYEPAAYDTHQKINSWWENSGVKTLNFNALESDKRTDVAIVGAGFTGLNAALQLAEKHQTDCTVLEAAQPGWGASGRNGGFACLGGTGLSVKTQIKKYGLAETKANIGLQMAAIDRVATNLEQYDINADTHSDGELQLAHKPAAFPGMLNEARFFKENFGIGFEGIEKAGQSSRGTDGPTFHGGVVTKAGFALNPLKYAQGLAQAVDNKTIPIHGNTPVLKIFRDSKGFVLETPKARLHAQRLIMATNGYSSEDIPQPLAGRLLPLLSTILVTRPITREEQSSQGWNSDLMAYDSRHLLHYFRLLPDGRFLFGQRGAVTSRSSATKAAQLANRRDFERMFPAWTQVETEYKWSGLVCLTRNQHQFAGPLEEMPGAFAALGYHGNGVAMASLSGRLIADIAVGGQHPLPRVMSSPLPRFPLANLRRWAIRGAYLQYQLIDRFF